MICAASESVRARVAYDIFISKQSTTSKREGDFLMRLKGGIAAGFLLSDVLVLFRRAERFSDARARHRCFQRAFGLIIFVFIRWR